MNISQLAKAVNVSTDTVRYYEKQGLLNPPNRQANGYRTYAVVHLEILRFIRGSQALGFSLHEIRALLPQLKNGTLARSEIELQLNIKMMQIDVNIAQLKTLKKELRATFELLSCPTTQPVSTANATATDNGSGVDVAVVRSGFNKRRVAQKSMAL